MFTGRFRRFGLAIVLAAVLPGSMAPGQVVEEGEPNPDLLVIAPTMPAAKDWTVSLGGTWQFAPEESKEFQPVKVPGFWGSSPQATAAGFEKTRQWKSGTYRREFTVPADKKGAVLEFLQMRWGGEVFVNGQSVGTYDLGHSLCRFDISRAMRPGTNLLEVKVRGWAGLERTKDGDIPIPIGAGNWFGIKDGGIPDEVYLRFHNAVRIDQVRVTPRLTGPSCNLLVELTAGDAPFKGRLVAQLLTEDLSRAKSHPKRVAVSLRPGQSRDVDVRSLVAPWGQAWQPDRPTLYRVMVWLESEDGQTIAAARDEVFGFREVKVRDGRVYLNNRPIALFGATELVMYSLLELMDDDARLEAIQVKLFKAMNGRAFRSHMNPLPRKWLDLCDRHGILVLSEFPNFPDVQRKSGESPYDMPGYWENLQREARGILAARYNHPCIVGWVASNEGNGFGDWERNWLVPLVKAMDPTRLVMLSADITPEIADSHIFAGMWWGTRADFDRTVAELAATYPGRVIGCSEYGQYDGGLRWHGRKIDRGSEEFQQALSQILMEQTETLRRHRFGLIMPYSYGGGWLGKSAWQSGRYEDAAMPYHALRNALAPLGLSIEVPRHVTAGAAVEVPLWVYSDAQDASGDLEASLYLLDRNPGYNWDGQVEGRKVLAEASVAVQIAPWQLYRHVVPLAMPDEPGDAWLAAVLRTKDKPAALAISLREVRAYAPPAPPAKPLKVGLIDKDDRLAAWLAARGHRVVPAYGDQKPDVIVIGEGRLYDERIRLFGAVVANRVLGGTRLVILEQANFDARVVQSDMRKALAGLMSLPLQTALENLFPHAAMERMVGSAADFRRFNGLDNVAMRVALVPSEQAVGGVATAPARLAPETGGTTTQPAATQPTDWVSLLDGYGAGDNPGYAVARKVYGKGEIVACQVPLVRRVSAQDGQGYDPLAERLLVWLIEANQ